MTKILKLYELPRNSFFRIAGIVLKFHLIDGVYSFCTDSKGNIHHIGASQEVEFLEDYNYEEDIIND